MYRYCNECCRPRWWPDVHNAGPCGHRVDRDGLLGSDRVGACDPHRVHAVARTRGKAGSVKLAAGTAVQVGDGVQLEMRRAPDGMIAVRAIHGRVDSHPDRAEATSAWIDMRTIQTVVARVGSGDVSSEVSVDLVVSMPRTALTAGLKCLQGLRIGSCVGIDITPDGRLVASGTGQDILRLVPREDNLLRAACLDSTRLLLNGEPFSTEVIRPGDVLGDGVRRWCWKGIERGFEPARAEGDFSVSASALTLQGRVRDFTASFRSGELAAVVGGSGSGKTTLVRMIAGILIPTSGVMTMQEHAKSIEYPSHELESFAAKIAPRVSYIPQDDAVLAELTVRQAVEFAYLLHPSNRGQARSSQALVEHVSFLLQETGLTEHAAKLVGRLSGGQRRRVNLALGLVGDPDLVILDEPTTGLDFDNERRTMRLLRRIAQQGHAVVVVTHSMEAIRFADRCIVVQAGPNGAEVAAEIKGRNRITASVSTIASLVAGKTASQGATPIAATRFRRTPRPRFIELVARGFRQWINTPTSAALAFVALPLLLGLMVRLGAGDFRKDRLAIGLVAIFWLGINQSVRDLLKDLDVIRREDLDGTSPTRQILARACFSCSTAAIAAIAMTLPLCWLSLDGWVLWFDYVGQFADPMRGTVDETLLPWPVTVLAFWAAGLMGGFFGLAIAAACSFARRKAEALAVLASVIVTLPQFLFSEKCLSDGLARDPKHFDLFFTTWHGRSEQAADMLSFLTVTRWTYLPLEAWYDRIHHTDIYRLSAVMLCSGAIASLIFASGLLTVSIHVERGASWLPRWRTRAKERGT